MLRNIAPAGLCFKIQCCGIDLVDSNSVIDVEGSGDSSLMGSDGSSGDNSLIEGCGVGGSGDSGGVKKLSLTSVDSSSGSYGSSVNVLRNWYSSVMCSSNLVVMMMSLGSKHFLSRLYWISGMCPMHTLQYMWYVPSDCHCVMKCPALYILLIYLLKSSRAKVVICPWVNQIVGFCVVWAILSEYAVYDAKGFFKCVWVVGCSSISEVDVIN